jgi:RHS repeat-associated protein
MTWDFKDQLLSVETADEGITYYVYDASGQRVRKVIHNQNDTKTEERIYLGSLEVYRKYNGAREGRLELIRETLHIMDDKQRIALVETRTDIADPEPLTRYQLGNHLGSALVELDKGTEVITYEEYHPYGSTSYHARRNQTDAWKRYRYTGKERDDESGLYYHGARYYAPWLGRWITCDPSGLLDGVGLYTYVNDNPIRLRDPSGQNSFEDLAQFIRNQAGFEQGARTPPTFQSSSGSPFGTAAHGTATGVVQEMQQLGFVNANRVVSEPVIVNDVIVSAGAGPAGAPKGSLAPDLLFTRPGTQGSGVGQQASVVAQELADIKYGGGQAAAKYSQVGVPVRTVNGLTSSAATQPSLAQMAAPQQPPAPSAPVPADAPAAPSVATESGAAEGAVSTMTTRLGAGAKIVKGLGVAGGIVGSLVGGVQVGTGLNQAIIEGKTGEGLVSLGEGSANLGLTIGAAALVKGKVITAAVGAGGAALTVAAGVAAAGAVALAGEDARRALRGEKSMAADAARYYSGLIKAGEREGGAAGKLKQAAGHVGDFLAFGFASLQGQSAFQIYKK